MRIHRLELLCSALLAFGFGTAHAQEGQLVEAQPAAEAPAEPAPIGQPAEEQPAEAGRWEPICDLNAEAGICMGNMSVELEQQGAALEALTELVSAAGAAARADFTGLAANLTVRGSIDRDNILAARGSIEEVGSDVRGGFFAQSAALVELNAKADLLVGSDDSPGLSDIYDAASKAASGGDVCANNCTGHGVCQFGRCFASASGVGELDGTIEATRVELQASMERVGADLSNVEAVLAAQGALVELNQGGLDAVQAEVGRIHETLLHAQALTALRADDEDIDLTVSLEQAARVVAAASEDFAALQAADVAPRGRAVVLHNHHQAGDGDARRIEAVLATAVAQLEAGDALKAVIAARVAYRLSGRERARHVTSIVHFIDDWQGESAYSE